MSTEANPELSRQREAAFAEVGRNVVLSQNIERMLKILLNRGRFTFTASQLKEWKDKAPAPYSKRMLGELIEPLINNHLTPGDPNGPALPPSREIAFGFEFRAELTDRERADFRARLETMVKQRNELIHHLLDWLQLDTVEHCRSAIQQLQRQRSAFEPLHRELRDILKVFLETYEQLPQMMAALAAKIEAQKRDRG